MTGPFASITVAVDGSPHADRAFAHALGLAKAFGASLTIISVVPFHPAAFGAPQLAPQMVADDDDEEVRACRTMLEKLQARALGEGIGSVVTELREGLVVDELLDYLAHHRPELLVVGSRGLSATKRLFLGSVSESLVHHAPCPVLVDRPIA
ncbi:MAG: universal stress protein [Thermoplasmata archaeon]|nr:universal stress protein [Thermoplasmata archaeon]